MQNIEINEPITSKYSGIVDAVRKNQDNGQCIKHAVNDAFTANLYKFQSDEDILTLASWFNGSFGKNAA